MSASISKEDSIAPLLTVFAVNIRIYFAKKNSSDEYSSESSTHEITNMIWINLSVA
jgi:hypothetical protein